MKKILFVLRKPPHSGTYVQEMLDIIMTVAAFDQAVTLLLLDDAVFQLKQRQQPENLGLKDTAAIFTALPLYNVDAIYVEAESLHERGLVAEQLIMPTITLPRHQIGIFMNKFDLTLAG